jgi:DNA transposition AAA+ family ATPase
MQALPLQANPASNATATSSPAFVETAEYRRFVEFCDSCRQYRYIGLCFGPPGVGKSLSALHYSRAGQIVPLDRWSSEAEDGKSIETILYTPSVVNSPSGVDSGIRHAREVLSSISTRAVRTEARSTLDRLRARDDSWRREHQDQPGYKLSQIPPLEPTYLQAFEDFETKTKAIPDPTSLIVVDEADRLRMSSLEQLRSIFDESGLGMVLIGMPGIEKRLARYSQFYSRIGFVHEYRPLPAAEIEALLAGSWTPPGVSLPSGALTGEIISRIAAMTEGNFRLLNRLLTQLERVLDVNDTKKVTPAVLEAARESLVIGLA